MEKSHSLPVCDQRNADGSCEVVYELVGIKRPPSPAACVKCIENYNPRSVNEITAGIAVAACKANKVTPPPYTMQILVGNQPHVEGIGRGPGTELKRLIEWFASERPGCKCKDRAAKMDRWGVEGCKQNIDTIVRWLSEEAAKRSAIASVLPDVAYRQLVKTAIRRAENRQTAKKIQPHLDWFVGITTAPRKEPTLYECIDSVRRAGWEPAVFAEPDSPTTDCRTLQNAERKGVWHNWYAMVEHALDTKSKYIITLQDDIVLHPDTRQFVEEVIDGYDGFLSLYTSKKYGYKKPPGIFRVRTRSLWGACALVFHREALESAITHPIARNWLGARPKTKRTREQTYLSRKQNPHKIANSDTAIGKAMNARKLPMWFINPSPAQHIARFSTISHGGNEGRRNCDPCADYSRPLKEQVLCES